jgi:hypothetical protein
VTTIVDAVAATRARNYRDPDDDPASLDWANPVDRCASALRAFTYETPETVGGMVTGEKGRAELEATWARLQATERQLWRRRAAILLEIGGG